MQCHALNSHGLALLKGKQYFCTMSDQLKIYNTLTKQKEVFKPIHSNNVGMYVCGPTVYNEVHLGNVRTFISFDVVYRWLKHIGYNVRYVRNITDVGHLTEESNEDKLLKQAKIEQLEPMEIAQKYTKDFHSVLRMFNCEDPSIEPTASGHIIEQIHMVQEIIDNGFAYEINGSVYFDVEKFNEDEGYGQLSGRNIEDLLNNTRELDGQSDKRSPLDFAIWKKAAPEHIMRWPSPWGNGFPGWHLECSVMSTKYLGKSFDIHGGGMDLKFPHHECEIAQNKGSSGKAGPNYWLHTNMLTVNGTKMSKSLGNGFTPRELIAGDHKLLDKAYSPMVVRFFMLQTHYSSTLDFSNNALQSAEKGFERLMKSKENLEQLQYQPGTIQPELEKEIITSLESITDHMNNDFNTAKALAELFEISNKINSFANQQLPIGAVSEQLFTKLRHEYKVFIEDVLGLHEEKQSDDDQFDNVMQFLIELRQQARENKNFATSDKIRDGLIKMGIQLLDGPKGTTWEKI